LENAAQHSLHPTALSRAQIGGLVRFQVVSQRGWFPAPARRVSSAVSPPEPHQKRPMQGHGQLMNAQLREELLQRHTEEQKLRMALIDKPNDSQLIERMLACDETRIKFTKLNPKMGDERRTRHGPGPSR